MNPTLNTTNMDGLNQELTRRGLPTHGLEAALAERLKPAIDHPQLARQLAAIMMGPEMIGMLCEGKYK